MKTPNSGFWSDLPMDILTSVFGRLSFVDLHRAKIVCLNWYSCSKQRLLCKERPPLLILFPENDVCALYNPDEARVYKTKRDFSGIRFLANSGNWFLVLDSKSKLNIINLFSEKQIDLPPLESMNRDHYSLERVGDNEFKEVTTVLRVGRPSVIIRNAKDLRGLLWVDEKKEEYVAIWFFNVSHEIMIDYIAVCKNGEDHYRRVPPRLWFPAISDMVLRGGVSLYVSMSDQYMQKLDLSGQEGFEDLTKNDDTLMPFHPSNARRDFYETTINYNIAVTTSGEVLLVEIYFYKKTMQRRFSLFKKDPNPGPDAIINDPNPLVEVHSLGDEALLLDLGITVPADHTLGIEPNSIYFTRHDRACKRGRKPSCLDICVFNLATKNLKRFPGLSNLNLTDARWFLPS
ncbi:PREDICTED: F-box protein At5g25290-like [Camelina sativa]|uniref:F-box protein At5g25290-like n=1 Tax=Camelina sativa TaxID=90675 RepID=A0ABM0T603_CAMSA|nr:PREDICTED: F-box protein At5g25290-like [Camelina sativa]